MYILKPFRLYPEAALVCKKITKTLQKKLFRAGVPNLFSVVPPSYKVFFWSAPRNIFQTGGANKTKKRSSTVNTEVAKKRSTLKKYYYLEFGIGLPSSDSWRTPRGTRTTGWEPLN
jgi:hypothetical protein